MNWNNKLAVSVAGGKGGIGKSSFTANLGVVLARQGLRTVIVDADIGAANLHTMVGVTFPEKTLADFLNSDITLEETLSTTPYENLKLLSSASDILSITSPTYKNNEKLFRSVRRLDVDALVFDVAAGTHHRAVDFFALAAIGIVVVEPLPTSLENAFLFVKKLLFRYLLRLFYHDTETKEFILKFTDPRFGRKNAHFSDLLVDLEQRKPQEVAAFRHRFAAERYKMCIVANSVRSPAQGTVIENFCKIVKRYLGLTPSILGLLPFESRMDNAIAQRLPFVVKYPGSEYEMELNRIVKKIGVQQPL